jgi:thiamine biosynthesis protein ThiS
MKITINGTQKEYANPVPIQELVSQYCKNPEHVIAEVNGEILRAPQWQGKSIADGDTIELVTFVGGG